MRARYPWGFRPLRYGQRSYPRCLYPRVRPRQTGLLEPARCDAPSPPGGRPIATASHVSHPALLKRKESVCCNKISIKLNRPEAGLHVHRKETELGAAYLCLAEVKSHATPRRRRRRRRSHAVLRRQALTQRNRKLLREAAPVLVAHLLLEAVQDLQAAANERVSRRSAGRGVRSAEYTTTTMSDEADTDLVEHLLEVVLGADPRGDRVTEEDEVLDDARRVVADHGADAAERRVFLLVVANVAQRRAPATEHVTRHSSQPNIVSA